MPRRGYGGLWFFAFAEFGSGFQFKLFRCAFAITQLGDNCIAGKVAVYCPHQRNPEHGSDLVDNRRNNFAGWSFYRAQSSQQYSGNHHRYRHRRRRL
jgi:hypothetical protein